MASLEEFRFGLTKEKPSSFHQISVSLKKYGIPYQDYNKPEARLSPQDTFIRYTSKLPDVLNEIYSGEDSRPPRAFLKFKIPPQPLFLLRGRLLEHTIDWERKFEEFKAINPFCIPVDRVRQLTRITDLHRLADFAEHLNEYPFEPVLLTIPKGWLRVENQIVEVFNTHHHPAFIQEWLEEVIERGRILSEVELIALFDKHDHLMMNKTISLLKHFKILK